MKLWQRSVTAYGMLLPFLAFYLLFMIVPLFLGVAVSLYRWSFAGDKIFVGLDNFVYMMKDADFWSSLGHTLYFVLLSTPVLVILGLALALLLHVKVKGSALFQTIFFMPNLLSIAVVTAVWTIMLQPYVGLINDFLHKIGIEQEIDWLTNPQYAWYSILLATIWWTVGFNMILFMAGLQEIPADLYEAASLDCANRRQILFLITLPLLRRVGALVTMLQIVASFKLFGQVWLMTRGGPGHTTRTIVQYIYETGFRQQNLGLASAMSYALMLIALVVIVLQFRLMNERKEAGERG